ncbi:MAG: Gmad2 immunoglobulin-like domain-containing protein [Patescibacteria group bacterium]
MNKIISILIAIVIVATGIWFYLNYYKIPSELKSFDDCVKAGYPIMESYPRQCKVPDGEVFTEDIGNELEKTDLIIIDSPRPNERIESPWQIKGRARGSWFFEATFPIKLLDKDGNVLASTEAQAQGEWTTDDFVLFKAELKFSATSDEKGTLILEKSNPSDLPQNADQLRVPVVFK